MTQPITGIFTNVLARSLSIVPLKCESTLLSRFAVTNSAISVFQVRYKTRKTSLRRTLKPMPWFMPRKLKYVDQKVTAENKEFLKELEEEQFSIDSPLNVELLPRSAWTPQSVRTGVIAKKIGIYPQWLKNGRKILTTLLQVQDNHVIKYHKPEDYQETKSGARYNGKYGCLVIGCGAASPQIFTNAYRGLFNESGVMPKRKLTKFVVTDDAKIPLGTALSAMHFRVGDYVDVSGRTIGHGFQGVMKRWGMRGGPAGCGHTKNHRRMGSIGGGSGRARILKGKKMPGHMGQERRRIVGLQILRINYKYNVLWVKGPAVPGHVHHYVNVRDTLLDKYKFKRDPNNVPFPTHYPEDEVPEEECFADVLFTMSDPTIEYAEDKDAAKN